jgi:hypothetical protein
LSRFQSATDKQQKIDAKRLAKGSTDAAVAAVSRKERRVVVTNDEDFAGLPSRGVYGVIWLRIPQSDAPGLLDALERLLAECRKWKGCCIELSLAGWRSSPLGRGKGRAA